MLKTVALIEWCGKSCSLAKDIFKHLLKQSIYCGICVESSFHQEPRRLCQVGAELWSVKLQVEVGLKNQC